MSGDGNAGKPKSIALFGLFGSGNFGNDGSLEVMLKTLHRELPQAQVFCICNGPDSVRSKFGIEAVLIRCSTQLTGAAATLNKLLFRIPGKFFDFLQALQYIRKADVMVVPGTGIFDDFGERPLGMPLDILKWCIVARIAGTKVAFVSIGAGPIGHRLSRLLVIAAARLAHYRSYRDTISKTFMESAGLSTGKDFVYPDIAFSLASPTEPPSKSPARSLTVGVGVMSYRGWYGFKGGGAIFVTYIEKLASFVVHILNNGYNVRVLTGQEGDSTAVEALVKAVLERRPDTPADRLRAPTSHSLHDLMRHISDIDVVVATRFHNIVCALKMGRPTISLGYSAKNDALMAEMGLPNFCQHVETFDVDMLIDQFSNLVGNLNAHGQKIRARNAEFNAELERQEAYLLANVIVSPS